MFEIFVLIAFCWIFFGAIRLAFKVAWGLAKVIAVILFILALPSLVSCLLYAGGIILLIPVAMVGLAWGILKACL